MKKVSLVLMLAGRIACSWAQTSLETIQSQTLSENSKWDLNRYVWSRTHSFGKPDKPNLDFDAIDNFTQLTDKLSVSPNGSYFVYGTFKGTPDLKKQETLIIQSTNDSWQKSFLNGKDGFFSEDSKQYVFTIGEDLCFLNLGSDKLRTVKQVSSYKSSAEQASWVAYQLMDDKSTVIIENLLSGKTIKIENVVSYEFDKAGQWLACQLKTEGKEFFLYNLSSGAEKHFPFVESYAFSNNSESLVTKSVINQDKDSKIEIQYITLPDGKINTVWTAPVKSASVISYSLDNTGKQVVLTVKGNVDNNTKNTIWYYKAGMDKAVLKVSSQTDGMDGFVIEGPATFTDNSSYIQFSLKSASANLKPAAESVQVKVWNHKDLFLQSVKQSSGQIVKTYKAVINPETSKVVCVDKEIEGDSYLIGDYAIINKLQRRQTDRFWEKNKLDSTWLINLKDGSHRFLSAATKRDRDMFWFSPSGNYIVFFDGDSGANYYSIHLPTGSVCKISKNISDRQLTYNDPNIRMADKNRMNPLGIAAWLNDDAGVLVYDNNDIWLLDLTGKNSAVNITNSYVASSGIIFSLTNSERFSPISPPIVDSHESMLLRAFDAKTKANGYYRKSIGVAGNPKLLSMGSCFMEFVVGCQDRNHSNSGLHPVKAKNSDVWIVQRQSATDAPDYYLTRDFKAFKGLTNYQPQKGFNWLTEELKTFRHLDGQSGQGILYKPENFDSTKKYPVLIIFYGTYSNSLNQFRVPQYNARAITPGDSPVWFLNNGYLVFTPDIYVAPGKYGPEAFNVIEGAAKYLKQLPYVDSNALGVCSHSWSAKLGAYIYTHSSSFGAMAITEGLIYGNMINVAFSRNLEDLEKGYQYGSLWDNKEAWFDQTTILNVDKAKSPLLLLCNKQSTQEYQDQTLQLFTALRRLEKKVWWLQYAKGGHNLEDLDEQKDYTIRYTQYFDHYLKQAPAPNWMTQGMTSSKGMDYAFELDPSGSCSSEKNPCAICEAWNKQYKRNPSMFDKPISEWHLDKDIADELERKQKPKRTKLDNEQVIENRKILNILKNGYAEDNKVKAIKKNSK